MRKFLFTVFLLVAMILLWPSSEPLESEAGSDQVESRQASVSLSASKPRRVTPLTGNELLGETPEEVAKAYIDLHRSEWGIKNYHRLHPTVFRTPMGTRINYAVYQDQIPIIGLGVRIHVDRNLRVKEVENEYRPLSRVDVPDDLPKPRDLAAKTFEDYYDVDEGAGLSEAPVLVPVNGSDKPVVAFVIPARERTRRRRPVQLLLRADDGQVLRRSVSREEF